MHKASLRVEWSDANLREIDEAKHLYIEAKQAGRKVVDLKGNPIEKFVPSIRGFIIEGQELSDDEFSIRFFDETGDRRLIWNANDPHQIKEAANRFNDYIARGWKAYAIDKKGNRGKKIFFFDANTQEIVFEDKNVREKIKGFGSKFSEIRVVPNTYPG